jgi:hypothetical protein
MQSMIAFCGLSCSTCQIHLATAETDFIRKKLMRTSIADFLAENYKMKIQPQEITDCDGCRAETGRLFSGCRGCEIRICALGKSIENCACCSEFACDKLREIFRTEAGARCRLEEIAKSLGNTNNNSRNENSRLP